MKRAQSVSGLEEQSLRAMSAAGEERRKKGSTASSRNNCIMHRQSPHAQLSTHVNCLVCVVAMSVLSTRTAAYSQPTRSYTRQINRHLDSEPGPPEFETPRPGYDVYGGRYGDHDGVQYNESNEYDPQHQQQQQTPATSFRTSEEPTFHMFDKQYPPSESERNDSRRKYATPRPPPPDDSVRINGNQNGSRGPRPPQEPYREQSSRRVNGARNDRVRKSGRDRQPRVNGELFDAFNEHIEAIDNQFQSSYPRRGYAADEYDENYARYEEMEYLDYPEDDNGSWYPSAGNEDFDIEDSRGYYGYREQPVRDLGEEEFDEYKPTNNYQTDAVSFDREVGVTKRRRRRERRRKELDRLEKDKLEREMRLFERRQQEEEDIRRMAEQERLRREEEEAEARAQFERAEKARKAKQAIERMINADRENLALLHQEQKLHPPTARSKEAGKSEPEGVRDGIVPPLPDTSDPFLLLGLDYNNPPETTEDIRKAFLKQAKKYHPDSIAVDTTAAERDLASTNFSKINNAYQLLKTKLERFQEDMSFATMGGGPQYDPRTSHIRQPFGRGYDFNGYGSIFNGSNSSRRNGAQRSNHQRASPFGNNRRQHRDSCHVQWN